MKRGVGLGVAAAVVAVAGGWLALTACGTKFEKAPAGNLDLDGGNSGACQAQTIDTLRSPVYMLIVLDGSGSIAENDKWKSAVAAPGGYFDQASQRVNGRS